MGYITAAAYAVTAGLSWRALICVRRSSDGTTLDGRRQQFWAFLTVAFIALGINKQLDMQSLMTEIGRWLAKSEGWYGRRRQYQELFILALALAGLSMGSLMVWRLRRADAAVKIGLIGLSFTMLFVVVRAASFHHLDTFLGTRIFGVKWNWILELGGIGVAAVGAAATHESSARLNRVDKRG